MPVLFVVLSNRPNVDDALEGSIKENFPGNFFPMSRGKWIVIGDGTAKEVSDKLGITSVPQKIGSAVVFATSGYFGRASSDMWEWIAAKNAT